MHLPNADGIGNRLLNERNDRYVGNIDQNNCFIPVNVVDYLLPDVLCLVNKDFKMLLVSR